MSEEKNFDEITDNSNSIEKPKRKLSVKQLENLAKGRAKAHERLRSAKKEQKEKDMESIVSDSKEPIVEEEEQEIEYVYKKKEKPKSKPKPKPKPKPKKKVVIVEESSSEEEEESSSDEEEYVYKKQSKKNKPKTQLPPPQPQSVKKPEKKIIFY